MTPAPDQAAETRCDYTIPDWPQRQCSRRGAVVLLATAKRIVRCWQHDPYRGDDETEDEGEEAYREHTAIG